MPFFRKKEKNKTWKRKNPKIYSGVPKRGNQEKRSRFSRFLFWILFLGFAGVSGYLLLFSPFLEMEAVSVEGNQNIASEEIVSRVNEVLSGKYMDIFPGAIFFWPAETKLTKN